jgi:hypothetical protein
MVISYTQVAWVVHDLNRSISRWIALGAGPFFVTESSVLPEREYRGDRGYDHFTAAHTFLSTTQIELIQPTTGHPSIFREVLDQKGECIHHYQPKCRVIDSDTFDSDSQVYREQGFELVQSMKIAGVGRIVFFDAVKDMGVYIELAERSEDLYQNSMDMYEAHVGWNGVNPIRQNKMMDIAAKVTAEN